MYVSGRLIMCSSWVSYGKGEHRYNRALLGDLTFWYCSAFPPFFGFGSTTPSKPIASFSNGCNGLPAFFLGTRSFFCFLALGGVAESNVSSCGEPASEAEPSSSVSGFALFFGAPAFSFTAFNVVCVVFFGAALAAVTAFLATAFGTALALNFYVLQVNQ